MTARILCAWLLLITSLSGWCGNLEWHGTFTQGGVIIGRTEPGTQLVLDKQAVRVSPEGVFVFGFDRDAPTMARLEARFPEGERVLRLLSVAPRKYDIQYIDGLPPQKVTPPPELLERIRQEAAQVAEVRRQDLSKPYFLNGFQWPVMGHITGVYGSQRILNGQPRRPHYGIDIAAPAGTPVQAPADGMVTFVHPNMYFSGGTLILDHGHGLSSSFLHLQSIHVKVGQKVKQGDMIATVGATGRVTGSHLDWRMNWFTERIDPGLLVPPMK
jgi:murein DD-endopeptidase MepM/ murein hydrolase activator NlpD